MGISSRLRDIRPPLPAPTDSMDEEGTSGIDTDVATTLTTRTDKSSYEIPADGSPITIPTPKIASKKEGLVPGHARDKSQNSTSLLIEYFEGSATGDNTKSRPTVRVKVSQGAKRRSGSGAHDAVQITGIDQNRKPSYTRRISLGSGKRAEVSDPKSESAEAGSWGNNSPNKPPIEIEVLDHNGSDVSTRSRGLAYNPLESNVSSMPADSMLEGSEVEQGGRSRSLDHDDDVTVKDGNYLQEPDYKDRSRSRSTERIAQKVMEKLNRSPATPLKSGKSKSERSLGRQYEDERYDQGSNVSNNPKLLGLVQDTIKNYILPEIQAAKDDQRSTRNPRSAENSRRGSLLDDGLVRRVSKSSSSPNISHKPKVVLNREGDDPGVVLSRGDSERRMRKTSGGSYSEERPRSKRSETSLRDAGAASRGAGILTAANLEKHDSQGDTHERRRKRKSKSRGSHSRSTGIAEGGEGAHTSKNEIPPLPMAGGKDDSELTRDSLVSDPTQSRETVAARTPLREISRGSGASRPATSRTPTRTPVSRNLGMSRENVSIDSPKSRDDGMSGDDRDAALAMTGVAGGALAMAAGDSYLKHVDADGYGDMSPSQRPTASPVQSVSSLRKNFEEDATGAKEHRPRSAASRSSAGLSREKRASQTSLPSGRSSPLARSAKRSPYAVGGAEDFARSPGTPTRESVEEFYEQGHRLNEQYRHSYNSASPNRDSFGATNRDSYQTNPYPQDEKRWTMFTEDSQGEQAVSASGEQGLRDISANPAYVHSPHAAESAVASLMGPSTVSSGSPTKASYNDRMPSQVREQGKDSPPMYQGSTLSQTMPSQDRWTALKEHAQSASGSTSRVDVRGVPSPRQSPAKSSERTSDRQTAFATSGMPRPDDPLPEIGHYDDSKSDISTDPSIVKGPLGGDITGKDAWPYTPEPAPVSQMNRSGRESRSLKSGQSKEDGMLAAAAAGGAALASGYGMRNAAVLDEADDRSLTPDIRGGGRAESTSPVPIRDQGFVSDAPPRSIGSLTPQSEQQRYSKSDVEEFNRAMDAQSVDEEDDPFGAHVKHARHISANSHGMASPIYDSATGKGKDHIQSKDIVALMDHLTVRDAQRNARDTEILVTLVRSAAEMRQSFDEMKRFILEQDRMIMQNTDRSVDSTAQKVLGGPRPLPAKSSGTLGTQSQEDIQTKRKGVLRRALRGLTGGKSANDLAKFEGMLMQILENVEDLKHQGGGPRDAPGSQTTDSLGEYERMRNAPDAGYEPEPLINSGASTPRQAPMQATNTPRGEKYQFHSGYDGRRGSVNRVSTVMEGDEDDQDVNGGHPPHHRFENSERLLTPTQEAYRQRGTNQDFTPPRMSTAYDGMQDTPPQRNSARTSMQDTPPQRNSAYMSGMQEDFTPKSDRQPKRQSNSSSIFGAPKISRWSKTTTSSAPPDPAYLDSPNVASRHQKAGSEASRSGLSLDEFADEEYELNEDDRLRSTQSLVREQERAEVRSVSQASKITRTPSPLVPSEVSARQHDAYEHARGMSPEQDDMDPEFDDPKYQAVRNSLLLQHPQPRQGPTGRHQTTLESQAQQFDDTSGTNSDVSQRTVSDFDPATWGSSGTAGLAKHRLSQFEPLSPVSMSSPRGGYGGSRFNRDDDPLVPGQKAQAPPTAKREEPRDIEEDEDEDERDWEPQYSNSGFSRGGYYSSPFGSGHLLEPIEEVRYSLETDSGHISPEPEIASAQAISMRSPARKITGPRPMGGIRSSSSEQPRIVETSGTVRRKPVGTY